MNTKKFIAEVLKRKPELANVDTYFYVSPVEFILSGFLCEITPRGAFLWKFIYPLFDKFDGLTLLYSQKLDYPRGYIDFEKTPKKDLASEFLLRIEPDFMGAYDLLTLDGFYSHILQRSDLLKNDHVSKAMGYCMILLSEEEKAKEYFVRAKFSPTAKIKQPFLAECDQMLTLLEVDREAARNETLARVAYMKKEIGL